MKTDAYCHFEGMTWPCPGERLTAIQRICRGYGGSLRTGDRLIIASVLHAYTQLVIGPTHGRAHKLSMVRKAALAS